MKMLQESSKEMQEAVDTALDEYEEVLTECCGSHFVEDTDFCSCCREHTSTKVEFTFNNQPYTFEYAPHAEKYGVLTKN